MSSSRLHFSLHQVAPVARHIKLGCVRGSFHVRSLLKGYDQANMSTFSFNAFTYDHRLRRTGHPVRSAIHKPQIGRSVVGWVTTSESLLLYVRQHFGLFNLGRSFPRKFWLS